MQETAKKTAKSVAISEIYDSYLRTLSQFHFLTGEQLTRRLYKMGMRTTVMARLKLLTDAGYLHAFWLPTIKSKSPHIYALAAKGVKYLRDEGLEVEVSYKPSELAELSHSFLWHILELNDFLITAYLLERARPECQVHLMQHDLDLKKKPIQTPASAFGDPRGGKPRAVVPDAFLDVRVNLIGDTVFCPSCNREQARTGARFCATCGSPLPEPKKRQRQYAIWVELDRGTEQTIDLFKQKIKKIVAAITTKKAQEYFNVKQIAAIVFPTTAGEKRVEQMRKWTMEVLAELRAPADIVDLFLFTPFTVNMTPEQVFLMSIWETPQKGQTPISLLG